MTRVLAILFFWLFATITFAADPQSKDRELYILQLQKRVAELQMEIFQLRFDNARALWKEQLKALGEPDPDDEKRKEEKK